VLRCGASETLWDEGRVRLPGRTGGNRKDSGFETQLIYRLPAHQGDDSMRTGLDVNLCHDGVLGDLGNESEKTVTG
jgi:hypothetical protein